MRKTLDTKFESKRGRIAQFGYIKTDSELNEIESGEFYLKPTLDFLPSMYSILVHKKSPLEILKHGLCEKEFALKIRNIFSCGNLYIAGYNNIKFDNEFIRNLFYRNLIPPYEHEYNGNNKKIDIMKMLLGAIDVFNAPIKSKINDKGKLSFKLEDIVSENEIKQKIELNTKNSHDALFDCYATLEVAKLIKNNIPKEFDELLKLSDKQVVNNIIEKAIKEKDYFYHTSTLLGNKNGFTFAVFPLAKHPMNSNSYLTFNLIEDPTPLIDLNTEDLKQRIFGKSSDLENANLSRISIKEIKINTYPLVFSKSAMQKSDFLKSREGDFEKHAKLLKSNIVRVKNKIEEIYKYKLEYSKSIDCTDVYDGIYDDFFENEDKENMASILKAEGREEIEKQYRLINKKLKDHRAIKLVSRFIWKYLYDIKELKKTEDYFEYCRKKIFVDKDDQGKTAIETFLESIKETEEIELNEVDKKLLEDTKKYALELSKIIGGKIEFS